MQSSRALAFAFAAAAMLAAACAPAAQTGPKPRVIMGSANFTENVILGEMYAQALEANGYTVERKLNLGSREIVAPALERGEINIYPEYLATYLSFVTKNTKEASNDAGATKRSIEEALRGTNLTILDHAAAQDRNTFVVTKATADRHGLRKVSDLTKVNGQLVLGGPPECPQRPKCALGLRDTYGVTFREFRPLDVGGPITVQSLESGQIDVALLFTTNPQIAVKGFVSLEDDKGLQAADNVAPLVRTDLLNQAGDLRGILNNVSSKLTTEDLIQLNKAVDVDRKDAKTAAAEWLKTKGIVK